MKLAEAVLDRLGQSGLEAGRRRSQGFDGVPRPFQGRVERSRVRAARGRVLDPLLRAGDRVQVHGADDRTRVGWNSPSWTTSCRRS